VVKTSRTRSISLKLLNEMSSPIKFGKRALRLLMLSSVNTFEESYKYYKEGNLSFELILEILLDDMCNSLRLDGNSYNTLILLLDKNRNFKLGNNVSSESN
jgi:hypothetical protein